MELEVSKKLTEAEERKIQMLERLANTIDNAVWLARNTGNNVSAQISLCESLIRTFPCSSKESKMPG